MGLILLISIAQTVVCSFEYKNSSPIHLFPYYTAASDRGCNDSSANPAYLPFIRNSYLAFSIDRPYSMDGIYTSNLKSGTHFKKIAFEVRWNRFGITEYMENSVDLNAGFSPRKWISIGLSASYYNISINSEDINFTSHQGDLKFGTVIYPIEWIGFAFYQDNIVSMFNKNFRTNDILFPERSWGIEISPIDGFVCTWNFNDSSTGFINSFSLTLNILSNLSIKGGYSPENESYSGAFSFIFKKMMVTYGIRFHSYLGTTHSISISLNYDKISFDSLKYGNEFRNSDKIKKININKCPANEIYKIPVLSSKHAYRMIKYKETIGPLSEKALIQIGLTNRDIIDLQSYIFGLIEIKRSNSWKSKNRKKFNKFKRYNKNYKKRRKIIFKRLMKIGIKPSMALQISIIAVGKNRSKLFAFIYSIQGISLEKKNKIKRLCR